jgi:hypothetical membrane protein
MTGHSIRQADTRGAGLDDQRLAGLLLFILAAQFMTVIMLTASMAIDYDFNGAAISDLGVIETTAMLFNLSLVAVGILDIVAGYLLYRSHGRVWILALFVLASIGAIGAGLVPLGTSDLHSLFAVLAFLFFNLQAIAIGARVRGPMRALSVGAGAIGLVFMVLMVIGDAGGSAAFGAIGHGGTERMIVYPAMLWMLAYGGYLLARPTSDEPPRTTPPS